MSQDKTYNTDISDTKTRSVTSYGRYGEVYETTQKYVEVNVTETIKNYDESGKVTKTKTNTYKYEKTVN